MVEILKLQVGEVLKCKGDDGVLFFYVESFGIDPIRHVPAVQRQSGWSGAVKVQRKNLCIVKTRHASEPIQQRLPAVNRLIN